MTFDRMVDDGIEVAEFLRAYLMTDKIILLSSSMGTLVGVPLVLRRPDLFFAFVGTDLNVNMARNEALSYQLTLDRLRAMGDKTAVAMLERIGADPSRWDLGAWNRKMRCTIKTVTVGPSLNDLLLPLILLSPGHNLRDIFHLFVGLQFAAAQLFEQFMSFDARRLGTRFEVPFFLFQGEADLFTLTAVAEEYFADVEAPMKRLALIKTAGHFAAFTQPDQFLSELLTHVRPLASASGKAML
jgi:pimeloyl-ACP methyl ester carboxylesterase